jgi:hypothetical protein
MAKERLRPNFGNAGAVNNLLSSAMMKMQRRLGSLSPAQRAAATRLEPPDFGIGGRAFSLFPARSTLPSIVVKDTD